ncbi:aldo/keto reductase [Psychrosphaera aestuarii]|uniref:aldo/keto reductase n=1 Tax=Psychrosphaera aestuarii TaxID=1266052 RepID=UPI001B32AA24|nr:aldo/keto reductase [Psychrosphaera aestuarii]
MKITTTLHNLGVSNRLVYGCMGLGGGWNNQAISDQDIKQAHEVIDVALEAGIQLFDHADIYTFNKAEQVFGKVIKQRPELLEQIVLQSKCGIRFEDDAGPKRYDFSKEWIESSVKGILKRLNIEQLPILLLHRPDPLMDSMELSDTLNTLQQQGLVGHFGVSNMSSHQMKSLQRNLNTPLVINQLELSLSKLDWLEQSVTSNVGSKVEHSFPIGTLEYCQDNEVQLQSWGSLSQGMFTGSSVANGNEDIKNTANLVKLIAKEQGVSPEAIILAWVMKHPANVMPIIGTTNCQRIKACQQALQVELSREQWYQLYVSSRGQELP